MSEQSMETSDGWKDHLTSHEGQQKEIKSFAEYAKTGVDALDIEYLQWWRAAAEKAYYAMTVQYFIEQEQAQVFQRKVQEQKKKMDKFEKYYLRVDKVEATVRFTAKETVVEIGKVLSERMKGLSTSDDVKKTEKLKEGEETQM